MKWRVLVSAPYLIPDLDRFDQVFQENGIDVVVPPVEERLDEAALSQWLAGVDGVVCGDDAFSASVIRAHPRLKVIAKWGTGIDSIDTEAADRHGVAVLNTPDAFTTPVADTVLGYILCFARRLPWMDADMQAGKWQKQLGRSLAESTVGIVGVGTIGQAVARRLVPFGSRILGNDVREVSGEFVADTGIEMTDLDRLLAASDFVSLNCDLNPTSQRIIGAGELDKMKRSAVLINTARGGLVHEEALEAALEAGGIAGAALDVFDQEPLPADSRLRSMENVLLAPHNANASPSAWERVHHLTIEKLIQGLRSAAERRRA